MTPGNSVDILDSKHIGETRTHFAVSTQFIVQRNEETSKIWQGLEALEVAVLKAHANISFLFDASVGRGVAIEEFSRPIGNATDLVKYGYAGGIQPDNVEQIIGKIQALARNTDVGVWIDMESGIRSSGEQGDAFSWEKAWGVCEMVNKMVEEGTVKIEEGHF